MLKIFLADDETDIRLGLKAIVERDAADCRVIGEASDGKKALEAVQELNPDVLITDIKMPVMDGIELIKRISEAGLNIRIIALSGYDEYKYVREAMKSGAIDYLIKPVDKITLLELLDKTAKKIEDDLAKERQIAEFSQKINSSIEILKEKFLIELIKGNTTEIQIKERLDELGAPFSGAFMLSLTGVDGLINLEKQMYDKFNISANNLLKQQIDQLSVRSRYNAFLTAEYEGRLAVLSILDENQPHTVFEEFCSFINSLNDEFFRQTGFKFVTGISEVFYSIEKTYVAYNQATEALQGRFYNSGDNILKYSSSNHVYGELSDRSLADNISRLINYIELGNAVNTRKELELILDRLCEKRVSPARFRELLKLIIANVSSVQQDFREAVENYISDGFDLIYHIEKEDTLTELKNFLTKSFSDITRHLSAERALRGKKIIEIAKDYINRHYSEGISLKTIADHVHLSPNYFSDLFKSDTGKNFIDFLIEVRINAAKKLLSKPDIKVYEVGQLVGYDDPASFNRVFKKVVSVSPAEYKKLIK